MPSESQMMKEFW